MKNDSFNDESEHNSMRSMPMKEISETKLQAYILVGAIGVAVILSADFISRIAQRGVEWIKVIGLSL
jgi:hypothetical protein